MPTLSFSRVATPFVAALVERLGGEVTVPAARLGNGTGLMFERVSSGIKFTIRRRNGEVIRSPGGLTPPEPTVEKKYEIEKIKDELEHEIGPSLAKCAECGLRFEKTHQKADGSDECPYCTIRETEASPVVRQIRELEAGIQARELQMHAAGSKIHRLEKMVQDKLDEVAAKSSEIAKLKRDLEAALLLARTGGRTLQARARETTNAVPTSRPIPSETFRQIAERLVAEIGGACVAHEMSMFRGGYGVVPSYEEHRLTVRVPVRNIV